MRWDDVPDSGDLAKQQADAMAQQMNQGGGLPGAEDGQVVTSGDVSDIVQALQQAYPGAEISVEGGDASAPAARRLRPRRAATIGSSSSSGWRS